MPFQPVSSSFRYAKTGKMYCVIYERGMPTKELFRSSEGTRSEAVQAMNEYLNDHPMMINRVVSA